MTIIDEWTRECLAIEVAGSIRSTRVIEQLAKLVSVHGAPRYLRSDNGPEFVSTAVMRWLLDAKIDAAHIAPGKPWQNGTDESFNGRFRDECLNMEWLRTRQEAVPLIETWRKHYNIVRPHSSLGYLTPHEFKAKNEQLKPCPEASLSRFDWSEEPRQVTELRVGAVAAGSPLLHVDRRLPSLMFHTGSKSRNLSPSWAEHSHTVSGSEPQAVIACCIASDIRSPWRVHCFCSARSAVARKPNAAGAARCPQRSVTPCH